MSEHSYQVSVQWEGNRGTGTSGYRDYGREHTVSAADLPDIPASADRTFHGDADRWNPEQLLIAALAQCHMLSYLHMATNASVVVVDYQDSARGTLVLNSDNSGQFSEVTLYPLVTLAAGASAEDQQAALDAHHSAHEACFIARSVNFAVNVEPTVVIQESGE
ncbi:OsmC family protein [Haematomicrobium sanguinis]|uniref:OsmC family protein n=1 Tax=Haematomicrobium sanguinis TaxID=479106 RepID=UPI00047C070B|nr:OsmC family protein [Haematomicrobium sanguinis]